MYVIYSWEMVMYARKIAAIILYIGSTLENIYSKYVTVYCGYRLVRSNMQYIYKQGKSEGFDSCDRPSNIT